MPPFNVVLGRLIAKFQLGLGEFGEAAAIKQLGFETASRGFSVGIIVAIVATI
jgi:hypothetical protein